MGRIGVEKTATVVAEQFDGLLASHGTDRDRLLRPFQRCCFYRASQRLGRAEKHKSQRHQRRERQQHIEDRPCQIDPKIADRRALLTREGARQTKRQGQGDRRIEEVIGGKADHLREMTHRRLARVGLPIGVGDEADGRIEGEVGRNGADLAPEERPPWLIV